MRLAAQHVPVTRRRWGAGIMAAALVAVVTGCSDGSDDASSGTTISGAGSCSSESGSAVLDQIAAAGSRILQVTLADSGNAPRKIGDGPAMTVVIDYPVTGVQLLPTSGPAPKTISIPGGTADGLTFDTSDMAVYTGPDGAALVYIVESAGTTVAESWPIVDDTVVVGLTCLNPEGLTGTPFTGQVRKYDTGTVSTVDGSKGIWPAVIAVPLDEFLSHLTTTG